MFLHRRIVRVSLAAALFAVLSSAPISVAQAQAAKPFAEFSASAVSLRDSVVAIAKAQVGRRYSTGGASPERGFDCSGLVKYILAALRVDAPRTSKAQARFGSAVPRDTNDLRPGDLLVFGRPKAGVSHVGIYIGNGRYVHASSVAGKVIESPLDRPPSALVKAFQSARRIFTSDTTAVATTATGTRGRP